MKEKKKKKILTTGVRHFLMFSISYSKYEKCGQCDIAKETIWDSLALSQEGTSKVFF
jgi:hypothetical protein